MISRRTKLSPERTAEIRRYATASACYKITRLCNPERETSAILLSRDESTGRTDETGRRVLQRPFCLWVIPQISARTREDRALISQSCEPKASSGLCGAEGIEQRWLSRPRAPRWVLEQLRQAG